jgi:hypothetical protein
MNIAIALGATTLWVVIIIAISRVKYGLALLAGLGAYFGAIGLVRALGIDAVAIAWATMAASMAAIYATTNTTTGGERNAGVVPSTIASFIVGLIGWPLVFPGIRTPKTDPTRAASPPPLAALVLESPDFATSDATRIETHAIGDAPTLADAPGSPQEHVTFATPLRAIFGGIAGVQSFRDLTITRASATGLAELRDSSGRGTSWDERAAYYFRLSDYDDSGGKVELLGPNEGVVETLLAFRDPEFERDAWYALAAAIGRAYRGAVLIEDSLHGLDA